MSKNSCLKETGLRYGQIFVCSDNPGQNIWQKVKKSSKIGQGFKNLLSNFACILRAIAKVSYLEERIVTRLRLHPNWTYS